MTTEWNMAPNPRFANNVTDGGWASTGVAVDRITSPPVALPSGYDACARCYYATGISYGIVQQDLAPGVPTDTSYLVASYEALVYNSTTQLQFVAWYADGSSEVDLTTPVSDAAWHRYTSVIFLLRQPVAWRFAVIMPSSADTIVEALYLTGVRVTATDSDDPLPYGDGDLSGWEWTGADHDSVSRTRLVPAAEPQPTYSLIVAGAEVEAENLRCSEAEWGGFDTCTFDVKSRPDWSAGGLKALSDVAVYWEGESIFEGRIADVGQETGEGAACTRRITCRGYFDVLKDDGAFRRTICDQDLTAWEDDQKDTNASKFNVVINEDIPFCGVSHFSNAILENDDIPYFVSNSARLIYQVTGGVAIPGEYIRGLHIHILDSITSADWEVTLHSRPSPNAYDLTDPPIWTSPGASGSAYSLTFSEEDLDPLATGTARCLVLRVKCITEATDFKFIGLAADSPHYGARIEEYKVTASDSAALSPEAIVEDLISPFTTAAQRWFPDASGITVGQMNFVDATTRYDIVEACNDLVRWQWGFGPGTVFTFRKPWTPATVPDRSCYDLPYGVAGPSLTLPLDDCWNSIDIGYDDRKGRPKIRRYDWSNSTLGGAPGDDGATTRRTFMQAPDGVHNAAQALTVAEAFAADHASGVPTGTVDLTGKVPLVDGSERHALLIRPGDYVYLRGAPSEEERCIRITRVEREPETQTATVEFGRNPSRLDRLLARRETKSKVRRKRK